MGKRDLVKAMCEERSLEFSRMRRSIELAAAFNEDERNRAVYLRDLQGELTKVVELSAKIRVLSEA